MTIKYSTRFLALFCVLLIAGCNQNSEEKPKVVKRDHAILDYRDTGAGGATLLFVHDLFSDQAIWNGQINAFSQDYRVITVDLPGHGNSQGKRPHYSLRGYAGDVYSLIKKLKLKNVILVGHGNGADICLMEATYRPKNIIGFIAVEGFSSAGLSPTAKNKRFLEEWRELKDSSAMSKFQKEYAGRKILADSQYISLHKKAESVNIAIGQELATQLLEVHKEQQKLLPKLHVKLHLIKSKKNSVSESALRMYCKNGYEIHNVKGSSHYPMVEKSGDFNKVLQQAIEDIARENDKTNRI